MFQPRSRAWLEHFFYCLLVDQDFRIPIRVGVDPTGFIDLHIDTAVATIKVGEVGATGISMWELCTGAEGLSPPGIMDEEATPVVEDRIVDRCGRIPVG